LGAERTGTAVFDTREDYERAWWFHRDALIAGVNRCFRPDAFWQIEHQSERKPGERDWQALERLGLLTLEEKHLVEKWACESTPNASAHIASAMKGHHDEHRTTIYRG
jgi:hypothetical protein